MKPITRPIADLGRVLEEILRDARGYSLDVNPSRVGDLAAAFDLKAAETGRLSRGPACPAERELDRVHRCELAFLLREAARRCAAWTAAGADAWCALLAEAFDAARADGLTLPEARMIGLAAGADAVALARASLALADHPLGRLELGLALHRRGESHAASAVLASALHEIAGIPGVVRARPWPDLIRGLAHVQECAGRTARARVLRDVLAECPN